MNSALVSVQNLTIEYVQHGIPIQAVRNVSLFIEKGRTLGLVGESGCGKSTMALALMNLLPATESRRVSGEIKIGNEKRIAMIFQDPFSALNPVLRVGYQIEEALDSKAASSERVKELLQQVQLQETERITTSYPHQLSGGQRQRVLIAMALARQPDLLIADEPTTALDVTVQNEILFLLKNLQKKFSMAMLFVTHNLDLINGFSDNIAVMYAGQIVEYGRTADVLSSPQHPYTQGLLKCRPTLKKTNGPIPVLDGQPPHPSSLPAGCPFHPRCRQVISPCSTMDPQERKAARSQVRCHLYPEK